MTATRYVEEAAYYGSKEAKEFMRRNNMVSLEDVVNEVMSKNRE